MTTQTLSGIPLANPINAITSTTAGTQALNAANQAIGSRFLAESGHGAIVGFIATCTSVTSPPVYRGSLQGATDRVTPSGTIKGSGTAKFDFTPAVGNTQYTLDSPYTPSQNEVLTLVLTYLSGTVGASNTATFAYRSSSLGNSIGVPYSIIQTAGTWTANSAGCPVLAPVYNDGYVGRNFTPYNSFTNNAATSGSNPKYYGTLFTPALSMTLSGAMVFFRTTAGLSFQVSLYEGSNTTPVSVSGSLNSDLMINSTSNVFQEFVPMPAYTLTAGTIYRLVIENTSANAFVTMPSASLKTQAALRAFWGELAGCTGSSGTLTWTDYASGTDWRSYPVIPCVDSIDGGAGGGGSDFYIGGM